MNRILLVIVSIFCICLCYIGCAVNTKKNTATNTVTIQSPTGQIKAEVLVDSQGRLFYTINRLKGPRNLQLKIENCKLEYVPGTGRRTISGEASSWNLPDARNLQLKIENCKLEYVRICKNGVFSRTGASMLEGVFLDDKSWQAADEIRSPCQEIYN
jgi:hypothetical protein